MAVVTAKTAVLNAIVFIGVAISIHAKRLAREGNCSGERVRSPEPSAPR